MLDLFIYLIYKKILWSFNLKQINKLQLLNLVNKINKKFLQQVIKFNKNFFNF